MDKAHCLEQWALCESGWFICGFVRGIRVIPRSCGRDDRRRGQRCSLLQEPRAPQPPAIALALIAVSWAAVRIRGRPPPLCGAATHTTATIPSTPGGDRSLPSARVAATTRGRQWCPSRSTSSTTECGRRLTWDTTSSSPSYLRSHRRASHAAERNAGSPGTNTDHAHRASNTPEALPPPACDTAGTIECTSAGATNPASPIISALITAVPIPRVRRRHPFH